MKYKEIIIDTCKSLLNLRMCSVELTIKICTKVTCLKQQKRDPHTVVKCSEKRRTLTSVTSEMSLKTKIPGTETGHIARHAKFSVKHAKSSRLPPNTLGS
jgi:hypothetical protein